MKNFQEMEKLHLISRDKLEIKSFVVEDEISFISLLAPELNWVNHI